MTMTLRALRTLAQLGLGTLPLLACSQQGAGRSRDVTATGGTIGAPPTGSSGTSVVVTSGSGGGSGGESTKSCLAETTMAEPAPLDIYVMLDISGSMLDVAGGGQQKWAAVKSAISAFLTDPASAGINVGIQYFPQRKPSVPATCTANDQCGAGGPCLLKVCQSYRGKVPNLNGVAACETDEDCQTIPAAVDYGPCQQGACRANSAACASNADCLQTVTEDFGPCLGLGVCSGDTSLNCQPVGSPCLPDPNGPDLGMCIELPASVCFHDTECNPSAYSTPAVEISPLDTGTPAVLASIDAQMPSGDTPSAPALAGAIAHAQQWASTNSGHSVVVVLATDGLPTECLPDTLSYSGTATQRALVEEVASIAQEGVFGTPSVATFVIGVFSAEDVGAPDNLRLIAQAGGTREAQIIDTGGNITQQFLDALNSIRKSRLACEFRIPENDTGAETDYMAVNVEFADDGTPETLYYVGTPDRCPAEGGWYYDDTSAKAPAKILVCPSTCAEFQDLAAGSIQVKLGCRTKVF
jgi:Mg-chelatase subunit ChlD